MLIREPSEGLTEEGAPWLRDVKDEQGLKKGSEKVQGQVQGTVKGRQTGKRYWRGLNSTNSKGCIDCSW